MDESVWVEFPTSRDVFVDGTFCGTTRQLMTVETGTHTFDLGKPPANPANYQPPSITKQVTGTTPLNPLVLTFVVAP
jgi:hypothetical protein